VTIDQASPFERPNVAAALSVLRDAEPRTLTDLTRETGLSRPTVEDALSRLIELRVVEDLAPDGGGKVGRPARLYRFRPEAGTVLGLDIGEHQVVAMVADLTGAELATVTDRVSASDSGDDRLTAVRGAIRNALSQAGRTRTDLWAAAAGTVGVIDAEGKVVISHLLPDWTGRNLGAQLRRSLLCPVKVENDANLAALAEHWRGAAVGVDDVIYLHASHRLGAGLLIGGKVHRGFGGAAGEIGALRLLHWDSAARHLALLDRPVPHDERDSTTERIFAAARDGDAAAVAAVEEFAHDLAAGIAAMASTIDPELVVIGGRAARGGDVLITPVQRRMVALCLRPPRVVASTLDEGSVALGALRTAMDIVDKEVFKR
jgi:predicted NBD/HSP70 family sugar kinase